MDKPVTIGLDLAADVFQVFGVDAKGAIVCRRQLWRSHVPAFSTRLELWFVVMKACAGAHYWARDVTVVGHEVLLVPPAYVKRGKTDAVDAETFCEADIRPTIRFAPVKSADHHTALLGHKVRDFLARQKMQIVNVIRTHLDEFGAVMAKGIHHVDRLFDAARDVPLRRAWPFHILSSQLRDTQARIDEVIARIIEMQVEDELARRLAKFPARETILSSALAATTPDVTAFRSAREMHLSRISPFGVVVWAT